MRRVVDHENSEPPAFVVEQEAVKGEVTDIATRTGLGVDVTAQGQGWTTNRFGNDAREFGQVVVFQPCADAGLDGGDLLC